MSLELKPLVKSDFEAILRLVEQPGVSHFLVDAPSLGRERLTLWFERSAKAFAHGRTGLFALREAEGEEADRIVGFAGLLVLDIGRPDDEYLLYAIDMDHRGRGLATEAAKRVVEFTAGKTRTKKIVATVDQENAASIRVMQKLGFTDGGVAAGERGDLRVFTLELK
ncbi:MAG: GNAT family N-acetyltransferase [Bdellovibrionota bacterium]